MGVEARRTFFHRQQDTSLVVEYETLRSLTIGANDTEVEFSGAAINVLHEVLVHCSEVFRRVSFVALVLP